MENKRLINARKLQEIVPWPMSHLGGYGLPTKARTLQIQALPHCFKRMHLHSAIWEAIRCSPLCNSL